VTLILKGNSIIFFYAIILQHTVRRNIMGWMRCHPREVDYAI